MKRKIVQFTVIKAVRDGDNWLIPYALCDDGTLWAYVPDKHKWEKIKSIPQDDDEGGK